MDSASEDTTIGDYVIPKGYLILANIWAAHHDADYWKEPLKFDPTRFLNEDGSKLVKQESFLPFSAGKRSCPGEMLAVVEVFMFTTFLLQSFNIKGRPGSALTEKAIFTGFATSPHKPDLVFEPR